MATLLDQAERLAHPVLPARDRTPPPVLDPNVFERSALYVALTDRLDLPRRRETSR